MRSAQSEDVLRGERDRLRARAAHGPSDSDARRRWAARSLAPSRSSAAEPSSASRWIRRRAAPGTRPHPRCFSRPCDRPPRTTRRWRRRGTTSAPRGNLRGSQGVQTRVLDRSRGYRRTRHVHAGPVRALRARGTVSHDFQLHGCHGAFGTPGEPEPRAPRKDCIYFLYSDIYVSPSGSDSTGQGTAGDPIAPCRSASTHLCQTRATFTCTRRWTAAIETIPSLTGRRGTVSSRRGARGRDKRGNTPTPYDKGYTGRQTRNYNGRQTGWRNPKTGQLYGGKSWSDNTRDTQRGFGYTVNRPIAACSRTGCTGARATASCNPTATWWRCGQKTRKTSRWTAGKKCGEERLHRGSTRGRVRLRHGVRVRPRRRHAKMRRSRHRSGRRPPPVLSGKAGIRTGTKDPNGAACWPGATGCQYRQPVDGRWGAAGQ